MVGGWVGGGWVSVMGGLFYLSRSADGVQQLFLRMMIELHHIRLEYHCAQDFEASI